MVAQAANPAVPGPGIGAVPRTLRDFPRNPIDFCTDLFKKYGDIVRFRIGPYVVYLLVNPEQRYEAPLPAGLAVI